MKVQAGPPEAPSPGAHVCAWWLLSIDVDGRGGACRSRGAMASRGSAVGRLCPLGVTLRRGPTPPWRESSSHLGRCNIDNVREQARFPSCAIRLEEFEGVLGCETGWDGIIFHPYI
jgi:hypothetical protein